MAANVRNYLTLPVPGHTVVETITKAGATAADAFLAYTRTGALPAVGAYAAGVCTKSTPATDPAAPIATIGYAIIRVKIGATIAVDGPVAVDAGEAIPATGTNYVLGRALDSSTGSTAGNPHFIVIKLS